jgi:hypothetical protein
MSLPPTLHLPQQQQQQQRPNKGDTDDGEGDGTGGGDRGGLVRNRSVSR